MLSGTRQLLMIGFVLMASLLAVSGSVYAYDSYWQGHLWGAAYTVYYIAPTVPMSFTDDIQWAASKWSEPSAFYFQPTASEPLGPGGNVGWVDEMVHYVAYCDVWYSGDEMYGFSMEFDKTENWTDAPCSSWWINGYRVSAVALHEFGHALDFVSVADSDTVMHSYYRCYTGLYDRDRQATDDLY